MRQMSIRVGIVVAMACAAFTAPALTVGTPLQSYVGDSVAQAATYIASTRCQLVRISPNTVVGYIEASGKGSSAKAASKASLQAVNDMVPRGHYKRHCQTNVWGVGGGRF